MSDNLSLWKSVETTDPKATKGFTKGGGFKGTAISPMWLIRRATELWGPMGSSWGITVITQQVIDGVGADKLHVVLAEVYYPGGKVPCFGQTQLCGQRKSGDTYLDEEAPKKSLTDALTKGLSWLGFAADVHMGLFDDVKYVNRVGQEFADKEVQQTIRDKAMLIMLPAAKKGLADLELAWKTLSADMRKACKDDLAGLKELAAAVDAKNGGANAAS